VRRAVRVGLLAALGLLSFATWRWHGPAWGRAQLLYWQRRCATYAPPADQVEFDNDPARVAALGATGDYHLLPHSDGPPGSRAASRKPPREWTEICRLSGWNVQSPPGPVLFLHQLRNEKGEERIVVVEYTPNSWVPVWITVVTPGGLLAGASLIRQSPGWVFPADSQSLRIFAGQPDPADPSRFSIRYEADGRTGTAEGTLSADNSVVFTAPDEPPKDEN
jgi:hypothetical protein